MGKLNIFEIILDNNPQAVYHAGQYVTGSVVVELTEPMKMRGIHLQLFGGAYVHWTERHSTGSGKKRRTVTRHYRNSQLYIDQRLILFGKRQGDMSGDNPVLGQGRYQYPFQFQLPPSLPSSFEGAHGNVRFYLKSTIDKPWKFDHHVKRPFTVISYVDLNTIPEASTPTAGQDDKMICCCCCASGPITASLALQRSGYVPGEYILINAEINNNSSRSISKSTVQLCQRVVFHATSKSRSTSDNVCRIEHPGIEPYGSDSYANQALQIPPLPPSFLKGCNIIDIHYTLKLVVDPSGPALDLDVPLEIVIGTIPLQNFQHVFAQAAFDAANYNMAYTPSGPPPALPSAPPSADMPAAPPPSYAECVSGKVNIRDDDDNEYTRGNLDWAPTYTYYTWNPPPGQPPPYDPNAVYPPPPAMPSAPGNGYAPPAGAY